MQTRIASALARSAVLPRPARRGVRARFWSGAAVLLCTALGGAPEARRITFAELAACPLVEDAAAVARGERLSEAVRTANGGTVRIAGYMLPLAVEQGRTRQFLLLRNQNACCFGQMPAANEYLVVEAPAPGIPVRMDTPVACVGRLRVAPVVSGGAVVQFYNLEQTALAEAGR